MPHFNTETPVDELDGVGHVPGYVPDILWDDSEALVAPGEVQAFWITVRVPRDARAARHSLPLTLTVNGRAHTLKVTVEVLPVQLQPRRNFPVTHWFYADSLCDWYKVDPWSKPL